MPGLVADATRIWELNLYWPLHAQCGVWDPKGKGVDVWECIRPHQSTPGTQVGTLNSARRNPIMIAMTRARVLLSPPPYALDRPPAERPPSEVHLSPNTHTPVHPLIIIIVTTNAIVRGYAYAFLVRPCRRRVLHLPYPPGVAPPALPCLASARARYSRSIDAAAIQAGSSRASLALKPPARVGRLA
ncbi:hypothetical protein ACG7TL_000501 [Trametes sanguinea]